MAPRPTPQAQSVRREISSVRQTLRQARSAGVARPPPDAAIDRQVENFLATPSTITVSFPEKTQDTTKLLDLTNELARVSESRLHSEAEANELRTHIEALRHEIISLQQVNDESQRQISGLEAQLEDIRRQYSEAQVSCSEANRREVQLSEQLNSVRNELQSEREDHRRALMAAQEAAASTLQSSLEAADSTYRSQLEEEQRLRKDTENRLHALESAREQNESQLGAQLREQSEQLAVLQAALADETEARRAIHEAFMNLRGRIRCYCRIRPGQAVFSLPRGEAGGLISVELPRERVTGGAGVRRRDFQFDHVFSPNSRQEDIFAEVTHLITSALDGSCVTILVYGQTGSGKTYTMVGEPGAEGIVPRAASQLFSSAQKAGWSLSAEGSVIEIYNNAYYDLVSSAPISRPDEATRTPVDSADAFIAAVNLALKRRHIASTQLNAHSSRSHTLFQLRLSVTAPSTSGSTQRTAMLTLVDLAGSERMDAAHGNGEGLTGKALAEREARVTEMRYINTGLSALAMVVQQLEAGSVHVSYRDNPLTWALQPSLSGSAKCCLLFCVGGGTGGVAESVNTLNFGQNCRQL